MQRGTATRVVLTLAALLTASASARGALPLPAGFVENAGQWNAPARYQMTAGVTADEPSRRLDIWLTESGYLYDMRELRRTPGPAAAHAVAIRFAGARQPSIEPSNPLPGIRNWLGGALDVTGARAWGAVTYRGLYPGIDLTFDAATPSRVMETTWRVAPGADPRAIALAVDGAVRVSLDRDGNLVLSTTLGDITEMHPVAFQLSSSGQRTAIPARFELDGGKVRFRIGAFDRSRTLVIDPVVLFSRRFGGSGAESVADMHEDATGRYVTGTTGSAAFPTSVGAYDTSLGGSYDWFASKFNLANDTLLWSTYIGGTSFEYGGASDLAGNGELVLTGSTYDPVASGFPYISTYGSMASGFKIGLFRLSADGSSRVAAAVFGNSYSSSHGADVEINDSTGDVYVTGSLNTADSNYVSTFPWGSGGFSTTFTGAFGFEPFVARLSGDFSVYRNATMIACYSGTSNDGGMDIAFDGSNNVYVTGWAMTPGTWQGTGSIGPGGNYDLFVAKFGADLTTRYYDTVIGGTSTDPNPGSSYTTVPDYFYQSTGDGLAVDASGRAWVTGLTASTDWPTTAGAYRTTNAGNYDVFVIAVNPAGSALTYGTMIGGASTDGGRGIAFDSADNVYVAGLAASTNYPVTPHATQAANAGSYDWVVSVFNPDLSQLLFSTYHGGTAADYAQAIVVGPDWKVRVAGITYAGGFPQVPSGGSPFGAGGDMDGAIASFDFTPAAVESPSTIPVAGSLGLAALAALLALAAVVALRRTLG